MTAVLKGLKKRDRSTVRVNTHTTLNYNIKILVHHGYLHFKFVLNPFSTLDVMERQKQKHGTTVPKGLTQMLNFLCYENMQRAKQNICLKFQLTQASTLAVTTK